MSAHTFFLRCGDCEEMYQAEINIMCGEPVWLKPKVKRDGCKHDVDSAEFWDGTAAKWKPQGDPLMSPSVEIVSVVSLVSALRAQRAEPMHTREVLHARQHGELNAFDMVLRELKELTKP